MTPQYAAPEQLVQGQVTTATDVYALGVLLYELLSGQHPTGAATRSPVELIRAIVEVEPRRMSSAVLGDAASAASVARHADRCGTTVSRLHIALRGNISRPSSPRHSRSRPPSAMSRSPSSQTICGRFCATSRSAPGPTRCGIEPRDSSPDMRARLRPRPWRC